MTPGARSEAPGVCGKHPGPRAFAVTTALVSGPVRHAMSGGTTGARAHRARPRRADSGSQEVTQVELGEGWMKNLGAVVKDPQLARVLNQ